MRCIERAKCVLRVVSNGEQSSVVRIDCSSPVCSVCARAPRLSQRATSSAHRRNRTSRLKWLSSATWAWGKPVSSFADVRIHSPLMYGFSWRACSYAQAQGWWALLQGALRSWLPLCDVPLSTVHHLHAHSHTHPPTHPHIQLHKTAHM